MVEVGESISDEVVNQQVAAEETSTNARRSATPWTLGSVEHILLELRNIDVKVKDEDAALILLVSLPLSYENFVQSLINVGKYIVSLEDVRLSLHTKILRHKVAGTNCKAVGLVASDSKWQSKFGKKKDVCVLA